VNDETHALGGKGIEVRRFNLSAKTAQVAVTQIVGHDQQNVRPRLLLDGQSDRGRQRQEFAIDP